MLNLFLYLSLSRLGMLWDFSGSREIRESRLDLCLVMQPWNDCTIVFKKNKTKKTKYTSIQEPLAVLCYNTERVAALWSRDNDWIQSSRSTMVTVICAGKEKISPVPLNLANWGRKHTVLLLAAVAGDLNRAWNDTIIVTYIKMKLEAFSLTLPIINTQKLLYFKCRSQKGVRKKADFYQCVSCI